MFRWIFGGLMLLSVLCSSLILFVPYTTIWKLERLEPRYRQVIAEQAAWNGSRISPSADFTQSPAYHYFWFRLSHTLQEYAHDQDGLHLFWCYCIYLISDVAWRHVDKRDTLAKRTLRGFATLYLTLITIALFMTLMLRGWQWDGPAPTASVLERLQLVPTLIGGFIVVLRSFRNFKTLSGVD